MPAIDLKTVTFRAHEGDGEGTMGPAPAASTFRISFGNVKWRAYENEMKLIPPPALSTGGSGGGGGGGGGAGDPGSFSLLLHSNLGTNNDEGVDIQFAGQSELYAYCEFYVPASALAAMVAPTSTRFYADVLEIAGPGGGFDSQHGVFFTNKDQSNVYTGSLYIWDYWSSQSQKKLVTADTWHNVELGIRHVGSGNYETRWAYDGVLSSGWAPFPTGLSASYMEYVRAGMLGPNSLVQQDWYVDNVETLLDGFLSQGGTSLLFGDGFESGDTSSWTNVYGTASVAAAP